MAGRVLSSALCKALHKNERLAHYLLKHISQRNIHQRRRANAVFCLSGRWLSTPEASKIDLKPSERVGTRTGPSHLLPNHASLMSTTDPNYAWYNVLGDAKPNTRSTSISYKPHTKPYDPSLPPSLHLTSVVIPGGAPLLSALGVGVKRSRGQLTAGGVVGSVGARCVWTSATCNKSGDTQDQTAAVAPWDAVRERKQQIREAGQDLLHDIKERRAKVRERVDAIIERENIWTVPNLLCVSRIAFSPYLCHLVLTADYTWALGLFMLAGFTDLLDGWIARSFPSQASRLGSFLDPLADKVLVAMLFLSLTYVGLIPLPLTGLIIYRDVLIIGGASYVRYTSLPPPKTLARYFDATHATAQLAPTTISKVNTAVQLGLITASLAAPVFTFTDHVFLKALCWVTAATTLSSGISYIFSRNTYKILAAVKKE